MVSRLDSDVGRLRALLKELKLDEKMLVTLPDGKSHDCSLDYAPDEGKAGRVTVKVDGKSVILDPAPEQRKTGARFDRFGFITTHIDGNGQTVYLDDLTYTVTGASPQCADTRSGKGHTQFPGAL